MTTSPKENADPPPELALANIRNVLTRLEETIIFGVIERAQFCRNAVIYAPGGVGPQLDGESLMGFLLRETERVHALVRRYLSPDEYPFYDNLPAPLLPALPPAGPLAPNRINLNVELRMRYETEIVPFLCRPGDDGQWGSSAVNDVHLLQALSKRIHYGKFVAESKYRAAPERLDALCRARDEAGLMAAITDAAVEAGVLERVRRKAELYGREFEADAGHWRVSPDAVRALYARWVIPMNKRVQVAYLMERKGAHA